MDSVRAASWRVTTWNVLLKGLLGRNKVKNSYDDWAEDPELDKTSAKFQEQKATMPDAMKLGKLNISVEAMQSLYATENPSVDSGSDGELDDVAVGGGGGGDSGSDDVGFSLFD